MGSRPGWWTLEADDLVTITLRRKHVRWFLSIVPTLGAFVPSIIGGWLGSGDQEQAIERAQARMRVEQVHQVCTAYGYQAEVGPPELFAATEMRTTHGGGD